MKTIPVILLISFTFYTCTFKEDLRYVKQYSIGETNVFIVEQCRYPCHPGILFVNVHDNENTSVKAAEYYLKEVGGRLINIENNGERFINFSYKGEYFSFDPNRIFSSAGIDSTVKLLSSQYNPAAATLVADFAARLISDFIDSTNLIVSLHNNRDSSLSIISYKNDHKINKDLGQIFINPAMDADDFILTTDTSLFKRIKAKNINVFFENADVIKDDGSLSVYAARHNIPYLNVEAQHEHLEEQVAMLRLLEDIVKEYREEMR